MSTSDSGAVRPVPEHLRTVTPRLLVSDGAAAIAFYGGRFGRLRDPFGQQWMMSQHIEDVPAEEMARRAAAFFSG